ncbi:beta-carotene 15,15'-monooxygenase, Brp/Blh family [Marivirga sericea]|uniref:Probable beta-carotene 15,15'-dioxygenase n=1 Tax=Marivirga sericea TaxID=1028 RepID=A0A1X7KQ95_9BACT|nr:Brp/Blh family beta-carotene 15,15'-dioxygenase [Marivirga sericea]SMG43399.1 beta-carotene 15,15'-monooxygenase, Brp/Blh family [Marivirga sericea]
MLKTNFLHVFITILVISVYPWLETLAFDIQLKITLALIFLLGIPHGAIDHILLKKKQQSSKAQIRFYVFYLGLIALYVVAWILFPYFSLVIFFLISFYHFGQSQFSDVNIDERSLSKKLLYLLWGGSIISGLFYHHYNKLIEFFLETPHFDQTATVITPTSLYNFFIVSSVGTIFLMAFILLRMSKSKKRFLSEVGVFFLLHLAFFTIPPLLAFALYFAVWHSLKVLYEEYQYLGMKRKKFNLNHFIRQLLPFTSISVVGVLLLLLAFSYYDFAISPFFLTIIFLSVLTLPHSVVMDSWYQKLQKK